MCGCEGTMGQNGTLNECICFCYRCLIELVSDQGPDFVNELVWGLVQHYAFVHKRSMVYYLQANGLAESTNKMQQGILRKIVEANRID